MNAIRTHFEQVPLEVVKKIMNQNHTEPLLPPDVDLPYPSWQVPLREALLETDMEKARDKVHRAEGAIFNRSQQLAGSPDGQQEREAIAYATQSLLELMTEKLKWPFPPIKRS